MTETDRLSVIAIIELAKNNGLMLASRVALKMAETFEGETREALKDLGQRLIAMTMPKPEAFVNNQMILDNLEMPDEA